jgi:hypothetical protein
LNGIRYILSSTRLSVCRGQSSALFYIKFDDLREHNGKSIQLWIGFNGPDYYIRVPVDDNSIGCRRFSPNTFSKIMKAAGVKKGTKKKK